MQLPFVSRKKYRRLAYEVSRLEQSRRALRRRARELKLHDTCDAREKLVAYEKTLAKYGRALAALQDMLVQAHHNFTCDKTQLIHQLDDVIRKARA